MPHVTSHDGCRLNVLVEGPDSGPPVMLAHYLGGVLGTFDEQAKFLAKSRRVVRFDTRGQGASDAPEGPYSVAILGQDVLAIMDALGIERADFIGVSQGGMAGMWLAANHPGRLERLVLANTTPFIPNKPVWDELATRALHEGMDAIARPTITGWLSDGFKASHPDRVETLVGHMAGMSPTGYAGNTRVLRDVDLRDALRTIAAPTLVIAGAEDGPRGASAPVMAESIADARLVVIPAAAHLSNLENPAAFNDALRTHFAM